MSRSNPATPTRLEEALNDAEPVVEAVDLPFEIIPPDLGLAVASKASIEGTFKPYFIDAVKLKGELSAITSPRVAKAARMEVRAVRLAAEKSRKELKEDSLVRSKAIDGANRLLLTILEPLEADLEKIENAEALKLQAERDEWTRVRKELISPFYDPSLPTPPDVWLTDMTDNQFEKALEGAKAASNARLEKALKEAALKVQQEEAARLERERVAAENEALRQQAAAAARVAADERAEAARVLAAEKAKAAQEAAVAKAAADKLAAEKQAEVDRLKAEARANNEKLRMASEASRNATGPTVAPGTYRAPDAAPAYVDPVVRTLEDQRNLGLVPPFCTDKERLLSIANIMESIPMSTAMTSLEGGALLKQVVVSRDKFVKWVREKAATLPEPASKAVIDDL